MGTTELAMTEKMGFCRKQRQGAVEYPTKYIPITDDDRNRSLELKSTIALSVCSWWRKSLVDTAVPCGAGH